MDGVVSRPRAMARRNPSVAIVGAGMSGIGMAIALRKAGVSDVTIYEKNSQLGGTWRDNTYPGLACDVPSRLYQFSFAPNPDWSHLFASGGEIQAYFVKVFEDFGLRAITKFDTEIVDARHDDGGWQLRTSSGEERRVDFLISATGVLHHPRYPDIRGMSEFDGPVMHSARWDHDVDMTGKRLAVVGTGATGVQIVCGLAGTVGKLELFQRTPQWILPVSNRSYSALTRAIHRLFPLLDRLAYRGYRRVFESLAKAYVGQGWRRKLLGALCRANLRTVRDPKLRKSLTPDYEPMCKRLVMSSEFYRAMQRKNVTLVDDAIDHIERRGIVTADGKLHELDAIVLATGFDAHAFMRPMKLTGRNGVTIDQAWSDGPRAYLTVALPDFPNFFMLLGPHSPVGNFPLTAVAEYQSGYIARWIDDWRDGRFDTVAPTERATAEFNRQMREALPNTTWASGCASWYLGKDGLPVLWPWTPSQHRARLLETPDPDAFDIRTSAAAKSPGYEPVRASPSS